MNKLFLILVFLVIGLFSCSTLNKNLIKHGEYEIAGGYFEDKKWDDSLIFERVSWFKELTLTFDIFQTKITESSPFFVWFSDSEKAMINACSDSFIALSYAWDPMQISRGMFYEQAEKNGYEELSVPHFHSNVKMHPHFARINIYLYKTRLFCRKGPKKGEFELSFPGFKRTTLKI